MTISNKNEALSLALGNIDKVFRDKIIDNYLELKHRAFKSAYSNEHDTVGITAGKFCETLLRFLQQTLSGNYIPFGTAVNMSAELGKSEKSPKTSGNESLRLIIPRAIGLIYTLRSKRGISHVGGEIEANAVDISTILKISDWIIVELARIYHDMPFEDAQGLVDSINTKEIPAVWEINGKKRVLKTGLNASDKILLLLYSDINNQAASEDLFEWTEYSNFTVFKSQTLKNMHKANLIEYDKELEYVHLSPIGVREVEQRILKAV